MQWWPIFKICFITLMYEVKTCNVVQMSNEEDLIQLSSKLLIILSNCRFRLTKFMSNSINVLNHLPASEISSKVKKLDFTEYPVERALGMLQDLKADIFTFSQVEKKIPKHEKRYFELYSINLWPSWNSNTIYFRAKAVNSRTVEPGNWLGWKNTVRFAIKMRKMATRLSKRNEGVYP